MGQHVDVDLTLEAISAVSVTNSEAPGFEFRGVEHGRYRLEALANGPEASGVQQSLLTRLPLEVGRTDVENLELVLEPVGVIEVELHAPGGRKLGAGVSTVGLRAADFNLTYWADNQTGFAGLKELPPGAYWLLTRTEEGSVSPRQSWMGEKRCTAK